MTFALSLLPNGLTVLRLAAALAFPWVEEEYWLPLAIFAGLSDLFDGVLSRLWNCPSVVGQLLDPVADKAFILAVLWTIWRNGWVSLLELCWLAARDLTVMGLMVIAVGLTKVPPRVLRPRWSGKVTTAAQFVVLTLILWRQSPMPLVVMITGGISLFAAIDYTWSAYWSYRELTSPAVSTPAAAPSIACPASGGARGEG